VPIIVERMDLGEPRDFNKSAGVAQTIRLVPQCKLCRAHIRGLRSIPNRLRGVYPFRKNPSICNECERKASENPPQKVMLSVLFGDIRDFTAMSEKLSPTALTSILNKYFGVVTVALLKQNALIDKFIGDGVMALFGPPLLLEGHERFALRAALEIQDRARSIDLNVGINCGEALLGNVGMGEVTDYTAIGDAVNVAARLQGEAKGGEIVISKNIYDVCNDLVPGDYQAEEASLTLKGKSEAVSVYILRPTAG